MSIKEKNVNEHEQRMRVSDALRIGSLYYILNREGRASPAGHLGERFGIVCICTVIHRPMIYTLITSHMNIF